MSASSVLRRGKSAHGRLQSSASSVVAAVPSVGSRNCREGGSGEAAGTASEEGLEVKKGHSRRVKSARETKLEQERSDIFPPAEPGAKKGAWGRTQYDDDFGKKQPITPVPVRPVSPTRRNNPHPAKPFLQWKHPVRVHQHKKSISPPEEAWKYIGESFYDDYIDTSNTGDAKNEVPVTNLAKIEFPGNKKNGTLSSHLISGTRAPLNPRACRVHKQPAGDQSPAAIRPPSPKSRMMHNTVRGNTLPVLREWLKTASNKERDLVLQMLTAAHTDSEDTRLQKALDDVLRPDSAARVQQWLQTATCSERKTLLGVLETLAVASAAQLSQQPALVAFPPASWLQLPAANNHHCRSYSYPVGLRPRVSHHHKSHTHNSSHYSRHSHHHHHHHRHHCHKSSGKRVSGGEDMTLVGKRVGVKKGSKTPELWHHKIPGPVTDELRVIHPGSVFTQPHKDRGRHFAIHPEWPTA